MSDLAGPVVGATIGFFIAGPTGAQWGWAIGGVAGSMLFADELEGPRIQDLSVQSGQYGVPIPVIYGTARTAGNVIWATDLVEHAREESAKGGPSYTTYTYTCSFAVALCEGEIAGVQKIWANNELIYDISPENFGETGIGTYRINVYPGSESQTADPRMQAELGAANTPAHRGLAYVVFEDFPLEKYGNRIPNFNFLVVRGGAEWRQDVVQLSSVDGEIGIYDEMTDTVVRLGLNGTSLNFFHVGSATDVGTVALPDDYEHIFPGPPGTFFIVGETESSVLHYSFATMSQIGSIADVDFYWTCYGAWSAYDNRVVLAKSNLSNHVVHFSCVQNPDGSYTYGPGLVNGTVDSSNHVWGSVTVTDEGFWVLTNGDKICVMRPALSVILDYQCSPSATEYTAGTRYAAYDNRRNLVYVTSPKTSQLYVVDLSGDEPAVTKYAVYAGENILYHTQTDTLIGVGTGFNPTYTVFDLDNLPSTIDSFAVDSPYPYIQGYPVEVIGWTDAILVSDISSSVPDGIFRIPFGLRLAAAPQALSEIVEDQSVRAGLDAADIDVTALSDMVDGYIVNRQMPARSNIEPLQVAYFFDAVESDDVLKFVKRGGVSVVTIPEDDLGGHEYGTTAPALLEQTRAQEPELPRTVSVNYISTATDYQQGTQYDRRLTGSANVETTLSLPIAMSDDDAAKIAAVNLYTAWANRNRVKFTTSLKYTAYEPTDVLTVTKENTAHTLRIVKKDEGGNGLIAWEAVSEDAAVYTQTLSGVGALSMPTQTVKNTVPTRLEMMDIPLLRDVDDGAGCYYAACGYRAGWDGMVLYKSADGGASWGQVGALADESQIGAAITALGDFRGGHVVDELNSITVRLTNTGQSLSGVSLANLLAGSNICLVGSEVVGFRDATLESDGSYTLTGLLRGLRGTQWAMSTHAVGDRFVLFSTAATRRLALDSSEIGMARQYKGVSIYTTLAQARTVELTNTAIGLKPYAPAHLGGGRNAAGDLTLNWVRCTRIGGEWRDYVDASQPEATLAYEVEIYSDATYTTLKRTITGITSETTSYSSANQVTDFGSNQSTVYAKVYQVSDTVGRGYALTGAV